MSAVQAVAKGTGKVVLSVVGDVRFFLVLTAGLAVGGFLARYYWNEWQRGRKKFPIIGQNPDYVPPTVAPTPTPGTPTPGKPPPGQPTNARPPGQPSPGVPARRRWGN